VHGAAHEDANIIFGAVIDQKMTGKVKITVIATGFDHAQAAVSPGRQASRHTPVDMSAFTSNRAAEEERMVVNGGRITRRGVVDLPGLSYRSSMPSDGTDDGLDVPAFLRRKDS
jgi:cell division protein FtsZ